VRVGDLAEVYETHPEERARSRINLKPAVLLMVLKEPEANTVRVADRLRRAAMELDRKLPEVRLVNLMDPGRFIKAAIKRIGTSIAIGFILAVLVLLYLLQDFRPTLAISSVNL
ncbi:MAG TPA: efflux RND transporter permease subunit, partial [Syntrophaceae bacterium]|nr:efflux RND transporter permease subunit [Syntrophaceae bacterium]